MMIYFFILSVFFFSIGLHRLKGSISVTYLAYGSMLKGGNYLSFPFSLTFLLWGLAFSPLVSDESKLPMVMTGIATSILLAFPATKYLKPKWLQWLEQNHKDIIPILQIEIQEMGSDVWDKQINTQNELEFWINEVKNKHGLV